MNGKELTVAILFAVVVVLLFLTMTEKDYNLRKEIEVSGVRDSAIREARETSNGTQKRWVLEAQDALGELGVLGDMKYIFVDNYGFKKEVIVRQDHKFGWAFEKLQANQALQFFYVPCQSQNYCADAGSYLVPILPGTREAVSIMMNSGGY